MFKFLFLIIVAMLFVGCGHLSINEEAVKQYKKPIKIDDNETLVYVIRDSNLFGAARSISVGVNDKIVANLDSGDYTYFKVNNGINNINITQGMMCSGYYALDSTSKDPVFLKYNYLDGTVEKLPTKLGISYIDSYHESTINNWQMENYGYINGLLNLANYHNLEIMSESNSTMQPDENNAIVTFIRTSNFHEVMFIGNKSEYTIWDEKGIIGNLNYGSYFQVKLPEGKHTFYAKGFMFDVLEANIKANKNYVIELKIRNNSELSKNSFTNNFKLQQSLMKENKGIVDYANIGNSIISSLASIEQRIATVSPEFVPIDLREVDDISLLLSDHKHIKLNSNLDENIQKRIEVATTMIQKLKEINTNSNNSIKLKPEFGIK